MANLNVSYAEMEHAAARLGADREDISGRLQSMQAYIQQLVSSGFVTDQASVRFHDMFVRYVQHANGTIAELQGIEQFLRSTASSLHDLDVQIASRIS